MPSANLEPRPLYAIGTVARLTRLKPDTLRVWERRYGLGASFRSKTGRRQYTQADLEHMQLVAALVNSGVRIGEIAACGRKTLDILVRAGVDAPAEILARKARVLVIGAALCEWLDEHQGCLSHVDANLARLALAEAERALDGIQAPDLLVVGCETLGAPQLRQLEALSASLGAERVLVAYREGNDRALQALREQGVGTTAFPPDPGFLAFELARLSAEVAAQGAGAVLGDFITGRPRQLSREDVDAAGAFPASADELHPARLAALVSDLVGLEDDIAAGAVGDWSDAAVRACAFTYASQARWLMEKALQHLLPHGDAVVVSEPAEQAGPLHDAA